MKLVELSYRLDVKIRLPFIEYYHLPGAAEDETSWVGDFPILEIRLRGSRVIPVYNGTCRNRQIQTRDTTSKKEMLDGGVQKD